MSAYAKKILIDWANEEKNWIRSIVKEVVETHKDVADSSINDIYNIFLSDNDLIDEPVAEVPKLILEASNSEDIDKLVINKLGRTENVNKLLPDQNIDFNDNVTILFGENAVGKSGYVRVLKRLAAVRSQEEILPNIHSSTSKAEPKSRIEYSIGDKNHTLDWNGEAGVNPFTRISIFDNRALSFHVDDDLTYYYIPRDITLFKFTNEAIHKIKEELEKSIKEQQPGANPFLTHFHNESTIYAKIETLGSSTDLKELESLAYINEDGEAKLVSLQEQVDALKPQIIESRVELAKTHKSLFEKISSFSDTINTFEWDTYNTYIDDLERLKTTYINTTENAFKDEMIDGILGESWQKFIEAGEVHIRELKDNDYPTADEKCIYCNQKLNEDAVSLIKKYREFCNNQVKIEIEELTKTIDDTLKTIINFSVGNLKDTLEEKEASSNDLENKLVSETLKLIREYAVILDKLNKKEKTDFQECKQLSSKINKDSNTLVKNIDELLQSLQKQGVERETAFQAKLKELYELQDRVSIKKYLSEINSYVKSAKWVSKANIINSTRIPSTIRNLTIKTKTASEDLLNRDFEKFFKEECKHLHAPEVLIDFPGRQGQAARRKSLHTSYRLSDILSEGEQKVIALSDFLAESLIRTSSSPIIFDDPVTSLDYKRLEYIVKRIFDLSRNNQVIVFTHSIWFATSLLAMFAEKSELRSKCSYYEVSSDGELVGKISPGSHPRWDTQKKLKGRINELIQNAESQKGETQQALIESTYDRIRAWCEVVMEQEVFKHVVQRYSPHVAMTMIPQINFDKIKDISMIIHNLYEKACRIMEGHSQPLETLHTRPDINELKEDWRTALDAIEEYNN